MAQTGRPKNEPDKEDLDIAEFFEEYGTRGQLKMYRIEGGRQRWVCSLDSVATMPEEEILEKFGPGRYLIRAKRAGTQKWIASQVFEIEGPTRPEVDIPYGIPQPHPGAISDQVFQLMTQSAERTHQMMLALIQNMGKGSSTFDPTAAMSAMVTGMASLKTLSENKSNGLEQVTQILDIAERVGGNGGSKSVTESLIEMAKDVVPALMAGRGVPAQPALNPSQPAKQIPAQPESTLNLEIRILWEQLVRAAMAQLDVDRVAGMLMDREELLGDNAATVILDSVLKTPNFAEWRKQVAAIDDAHTAWFERLYSEIRRDVGLNDEPAGKVEDDPPLETTQEA